MAATKRKRRGGFAVQAKKPKRNEKDAKQPAKLRDMAEEAEEEEKDRIPGPVCKVERAHVPVTPAALHAFPGTASLMRPLLISELRICYRSSVSAFLPVRRPPRLRLALLHVAVSGRRRLRRRAGFGTLTRFTGKQPLGYSVPVLCLLITPSHPPWGGITFP